MENLFFDLGYSYPIQLLYRVLAFLVLSSIAIYVIFLVLSKALFKNNKHRKEVNLRLILLWSLVVYLILFNIYILALLYVNGIDLLNWSDPLFYLGLSAQILIYLSILIYFFIYRKELQRLIAEKSLN